MKKKKQVNIELVITVALKKEIPKDWLMTRHVPVQTLAALKSGGLGLQGGTSRGMLVVITGAGLKASEEAACWIRDTLDPLFVLNIGTCGLIDKRRTTGNWIIPGHVTDEDGDTIELDTRLPVPLPEKPVHVDSLLSVRKAGAGNIPASWKKHDIIDMECCAQARIFSSTSVTFHSLKFGTDYSDSNTYSDYNNNLDLFRQEIKKLFNFLESTPTRLNITAIIPVYNREHTIERAIDSILQQSCPAYEIIVVDDCSTDRTGEILDGYGEKITCIYLPKNSGPSKARNEGIKRAGTDWIAFLDSDDMWEKDKLKGQIEFLTQHPFYQIMQSDEKWIRNGKRVNPCKHHARPRGWIWEPSLERCLVSPSGVLLSKSLFEHCGFFDEDLPVCEDYDLWLRISRHHPVGLEPDLSVIKYGGHRDQLSVGYPAMDRLRVQSLMGLLKNESHPSFCNKIIEILTKKLNILINGYKKRGKSEDAGKCLDMLNSLKDYQ